MEECQHGWELGRAQESGLERECGGVIIGFICFGGSSVLTQQDLAEVSQLWARYASFLRPRMVLACLRRTVLGYLCTFPPSGHDFCANRGYNRQKRLQKARNPMANS